MLNDAAAIFWLIEDPLCYKGQNQYLMKAQNER